ncbi:inositol-1-monophosphatase [Candidatus Curculioniphilus buchneri]|uniref:inositol-1-monophosphatase n=1 Tax=Candidatus Curculioniphilus buchneri TaxID=690594 RepID=UPI00376F1E93
MHPMLNIACRSARKAGNLIAKYYETSSTITVNQKIEFDFITNIYQKVEHLIVEIIHKSYPQHIIISEANAQLLDTDNNVQWIVNSLDGMANFIKRLPHFAISVAVRTKGYTEVAVVYDPMRNELFTAVRGQGAQMNGYRLRGSIARTLDGVILATGFPVLQRQYYHNYLILLSNLHIQQVDFRCTGSVALDLSYVAAGRMDGFFKMGLKPWSVISGELIIREAGGIVTDFSGDHNYFTSGNMIAGNPRILKAILLTMNKKYRQNI